MSTYTQTSSRTFLSTMIQILGFNSGTVIKGGSTQNFTSGRAGGNPSLASLLMAAYVQSNPRTRWSYEFGHANASNPRALQPRSDCRNMGLDFVWIPRTVNIGRYISSTDLAALDALANQPGGVTAEALATAIDNLMAQVATNAA